MTTSDLFGFDFKYEGFLFFSYLRNWPSGKIFKLDLYLNLHTKVNYRWISGLNINNETINVLKKKNLKVGKAPQNPETIKEKMSKFNYIKLLILHEKSNKQN